MSLLDKFKSVIRSVLRIGNIVVPILRGLRDLVPEIDQGFEAIDNAIEQGGVQADDFFDRNLETIEGMREFFGDLSELAKEGMYFTDKAIQYSQLDTPDLISIEEAEELARSLDRLRQRLQDVVTHSEGLEDAAAGFRVTAQRTDGGLDAVMHSAVFMLVDQYGVVRGVYSSEEPGEFKALVRDARTLLGAGAGPAPVAQARSGEVLFHELSCANCHEHPELAPPLGGLLGQQRELETRLLVTADEAYLKESIVAPVAKRVAGYPLMMPSFAGHLTNEELDSLVKYVVALPPPTTNPDVHVEVDPVCHMKVRVTENAFSVTTDAGTTYFCSAWCKARFTENPDAYRR